MAGVNWRMTSRPAAAKIVRKLAQSRSVLASLTKDGVEMKSDADLVAVEVLVVIAFTRRSMV